MLLEQLWKQSGSTLINKAGVWKSTDEWKFIPNDDRTMYYIEVTSDKKKVLGINSAKVIPEVKDVNKAGQLWIKGKERGGYFTLKNLESSQFLTANSARSLITKGN